MPKKHRLWRKCLRRGALLFSVFALGACSLILPPHGKTVFRAKTKAKVLALSFDDGPNPQATPRLLDVLRAEGVSATFFLTGQHIEAYPDLARRILREGHEVGNHSYDGSLLAFLSKARAAERIGRADTALRAIGAPEKTLFRPPGLIQGWGTASFLAAQDRTAVLASVWAWDWKPQEARKIRQRVFDHAKRGSIIVLHDGDAAKDSADRSWTVDAVPGIIADLKARGFRFTTVSKLLAMED